MLHHGGYALVLVALVAGVALNYFGLKLHYFALFMGGAVVGFMIGAPASALAGNSQEQTVVMAVVSALLCGFLAIALTQAAIFLTGAVISCIIAVACGVQEPWVLILFAFIGGGVAIQLYNFAIIIMTSFSGAALLFYSLVNGHALLTTGQVSYLPVGGLRYMQRLGRSLMDGSVQTMLDTARADLWLFLLLMATGVVVQWGLHKVMKLPLGPKRSKAERRLNRKLRKAEKRRDAQDGGVAQSFPLSQPESDPMQQYRVPPVANPPGPRSSRRPVRMRIHGGGVLHCCVDLVPCAMDIGRSPECAVHLPDPTVSRLHARLRVGGDGTVLLEDMGSANGVLLGGVSRVAKHVVGPGEWFGVGGYELRFE